MKTKRTMLLTGNEGIRKYGSEYLLEKEVREGRLFKLGKGIYSDDPRVPLEAVLAYRYKGAVFCGLYALYHYDLTDLVPSRYEMATDRDAFKIKDPRVKQVFVPKKTLGVGVSTQYISGYPIRIYDIERTLVDLLRNKASMPYDLYKECVLNYRKIADRLDMRKIEEYASVCPKGELALRRLNEEIL